MAEQDLQSLVCSSDDECAVRLGKILKVSHIVTGSMGKVGATYTILARVISVETGQVVRTPSKRYQGAIDGLFDELTPIAFGIVGKRFVNARRQTAKVTRSPVTRPLSTETPVSNKPKVKKSPSKDPMYNAISIIFTIWGLVYLYLALTGGG